MIRFGGSGRLGPQNQATARTKSKPEPTRGNMSFTYLLDEIVLP